MTDNRAARFKLDVGQWRRTRWRSERYLTFVRGLPCLITGSPGVEAAHIRFSELRYGKRGTGMGEKPDDRWAVPLGPSQHRDQHSHNERRWWESKGIDPCLVASLLFSHFSAGDDAGAEAVCMSARQGLLNFTEEG